MSTSNSKNATHYKTLLEALASAPADRAFVTMWKDEDDVKSVSFGEFTQIARAQAASFKSHDVKSGDRVILVMPQGIELMAAFVGAMMLGAVPAILAYPNFKLDPEKYRSGLAGVTANLKARVVVLDREFPKELESFVTVGEGTEVIRGAAADAAAPAIALPSIGADDLAFIQHSAGTTGLQKGVALTHGAVLRQLAHLGGVLDINDNDKLYSWLPLYHDMGLIACFMLPLTFHLPIVMQSPTDWVMQPGTMLQLITQHKCTMAWAPNFTLQFLARRVHPDDREELDLSSLRAIVNCSEPVRGSSMDEFVKAFGNCKLKANVLQASYAMAENVFAVTQTDPSKPPVRISVDGNKIRDEHKAVVVETSNSSAFDFVSSGRCIPGNEVRITTPDGEDLADGHVGEILIKSDSLFGGYYNRPDTTAKAFKDGWYITGDLGFRLDGELYVIGRKKDLIIVAGKNIYPQDVEEITCRHPLIHDGRAVAMGMFNSDLGTEDIVVVAEVDNEEQLAQAFEIERAVKGAVNAELGVGVRAVYVKPPRWIVKSSAGKPARSTTREKLVNEHPELKS